MRPSAAMRLALSAAMFGIIAGFTISIPLSRSNAWSLPSPAPPALLLPPPIHAIASAVPSVVVMIGEVCPPETPHQTSVIVPGGEILSAKRLPALPIAHPPPFVQLLFATA